MVRITLPFQGVAVVLFAASAACAYAQTLGQERPDRAEQAIELADLFCREARQRIKTTFHRFYGKNDGAIYRVSQRVLDGKHAWLEQGIVGIMEEKPAAPVRAAPRRAPRAIVQPTASSTSPAAPSRNSGT